MEVKQFESPGLLRHHLEIDLGHPRVWHPIAELVFEASKADSADTVKSELSGYIDYLKGLNPTERTHYQNLDDWTNPVYDFAHKKMDEHGFVNGDVEANKTKPLVQVWFSIYSLISDIVWSPKLKSEVANHHSSALSRSNALIAELEDAMHIIDKITL